MCSTDGELSENGNPHSASTHAIVYAPPGNWHHAAAQVQLVFPFCVESKQTCACYKHIIIKEESRWLWYLWLKQSRGLVFSIVKLTNSSHVLEHVTSSSPCWVFGGTFCLKFACLGFFPVPKNPHIGLNVICDFKLRSFGYFDFYLLSNNIDTALNGTS